LFSCIGRYPKKIKKKPKTQPNKQQTKHSSTMSGMKVNVMIGAVLVVALAGVILGIVSLVITGKDGKDGDHGTNGTKGIKGNTGSPGAAGTDSPVTATKGVFTPIVNVAYFNKILENNVEEVTLNGVKRVNVHIRGIVGTGFTSIITGAFDLGTITNVGKPDITDQRVIAAMGSFNTATGIGQDPDSLPGVEIKIVSEAITVQIMDAAVAAFVKVAASGNVFNLDFSYIVGTA
jgi:hypothetical protein